MGEVKAKIESIIRNIQKIKEMNRKRLAKKIKNVMYMDNGIETDTFEDKCIEYRLSPREREVLQLTLEGKSAKDIAGKLGLSAHTVRNHTRHIYKKCGVKNRAELLHLFRR
jgi:DNA-binding CsgD family transcriptional regulator